MNFETGSAETSHPEIRGPNEIRRPKSERRRGSAFGDAFFQVGSGIHFRPSDFGLLSDFEFYSSTAATDPNRFPLNSLRRVPGQIDLHRRHLPDVLAVFANRTVRGKIADADFLTIRL